MPDFPCSTEHKLRPCGKLHGFSFQNGFYFGNTAMDSEGNSDASARLRAERLKLRFGMKHILLAIFGLLLTVSMAFAQNSYRVKSGDTLTIEVLEDASLSRNVLVLPGGTFDFPYAGTIRASRRTPEQIEAAIAQGIASNFTNPPTVFVSVASLRPREEPREPPEPVRMPVYVLGEVAEPGLKEVRPGTTFLQALSQAGGFTNFAAKKRVQLRRTDPRTGAQSVSVINYRALSRGAAQNRSIKLQEGDVIMIPERRLFE